VPDGLVDRRPEPEDPGIAAHSHVELCTSVWRFCIQSAVGRVASEDWQAHRWCGPRMSCGRSAMPLHSAPTVDGALGRLEGRPAQSANVTIIRFYMWTCCNAARNLAISRILSMGGNVLYWLLVRWWISCIHWQVFQREKWLWGENDWGMQGKHIPMHELLTCSFFYSIF